jgi:glycosyltransferase involved in cell wall biosynthesis
MTIVIFTAQVGHYHDARYRAVADTGTPFTVLATQNEADFAEFMASRTGGYAVRHLFNGFAAYEQACATGEVWTVVHSQLSAHDPTVVVVAGWASPESFAAIAWARKRRRRIVMLSESKYDDAPRSLFREAIKRRIVSLSDAAVVGGPAHMEYALTLGLQADSVFTGYDAVDNAYFAAGAQAARVEPEMMRLRLEIPHRYLLASARFIPKKNLPRLVSAYAGAMSGRTDGPDLVILGDGSERAAIAAAIARSGVSGRVHLPGFKSYADLPALYALSEGFVHVSTSEQWGLVINEAAASGVPVVASSACGATGALVADGVSGFVVNADSEASICNGLRRLIDLDPDRRTVMGQAAQRRAADWGPERFVGGLMSACHAAERRAARGLAPLDAALLRTMARRSVIAVP